MGISSSEELSMVIDMRDLNKAFIRHLMNYALEALTAKSSRYLIANIPRQIVNGAFWRMFWSKRCQVAGMFSQQESFEVVIQIINLMLLDLGLREGRVARRVRGSGASRLCVQTKVDTSLIIKSELWSVQRLVIRTNTNDLSNKLTYIP